MSLTPNRPLGRRPRSSFRLATGVITLLVVVGAVAVATDAFGVGRLFDRAVARIDRLVSGPVPDRATAQTVLVTPRPATSGSPAPSAIPVSSSTPEGSPRPTSTKPTPQQ